jgi:hypothetical protein
VVGAGWHGRPYREQKDAGELLVVPSDPRQSTSLCTGESLFSDKKQDRE